VTDQVQVEMFRNMPQILTAAGMLMTALGTIVTAMLTARNLEKTTTLNKTVDGHLAAERAATQAREDAIRTQAVRLATHAAEDVAAGAATAKEDRACDLAQAVAKQVAELERRLAQSQAREAPPGPIEVVVVGPQASRIPVAPAEAP
jgi:hypothetical protein